jgi:hypothetical protein
MRNAASVDTFDTLVNEAISIDIRLQEPQQELKDDPRARVVTIDRRPPPRRPGRNNLANRGNRYQPDVGRRVHNNIHSGYYGPEATDHSNLNIRSKRWNQKKSKGSHQDKSKVVCYNCNKPGHFARDCRMENKAIRQLNVPTRKDADASEGSEVLTDYIGGLMEDTEPEEDPQDYIDGNDRFDRAPTPYRENAQHWAQQAEQESIDAGVIVRNDLVCARNGKELCCSNKQNPVATRDWIEKSLRQRQRHERIQAEDVAPDTKFQDSCERALVAINNLLKTKVEWNSGWIEDWANNEQATLEQLEKANGDQKHLWEPNFGRKPMMVVSPQPQYDLDLRNFKHGLRSWTACPHDHCSVHYDAKINSGWFPSLKKTCKLLWYDCKRDICEVHLWDKRSKLHFPGTDDPQKIIQMQLVINGSCYNAHWQHCLNKDCGLHRDSKYNNGFGDEEPFVGLRRRAPGFEPSIP